MDVTRLNYLFRRHLSCRLLLCCLIYTLTTPCAVYAASTWDWRVLEALSHDRKSYTQGLVVDGEHLIESSGLYRLSYLRRYHAISGETLAYQKLPGTVFAEGISLVGDDLYCLTWKSGRVLVLDRESLQPKREFRQPGQGWGLTEYQGRLLMSNGSATLTFRDPESFSITRRLDVTLRGVPVTRLNDLTVADGLIWANVFLSEELLAIDPESGHVVGRLDLSPLVQREPRKHREYVLNGVAWDEKREALWVTGKRWQHRYLLRLIPPQQVRAPAQ